jgi:hypothetical protein
MEFTTPQELFAELSFEVWLDNDRDLTTDSRFRTLTEGAD